MPTIRDVARACGLSAATVSYVLNDSRAVRPQTRERVLRAVRSLDYHPSAVARGLSRKRMDTIGVVFPATRESASPITSSYYAPVLDGILEVARRERQNVTLFQTGPRDGARERLSAYRDGRCDGLLFVGVAEGDEVVDALAATDLPLVIVGSHGSDARPCRVDVDNEAAARAMTRYLLDLGHRRIGLVSLAPLHGAYIPLRIEGWRAALSDAGVAPCPGPLYVEPSEDSVRDALEGFLTAPAERRPTALFCLRDVEAVRVLRVLAERDLCVPGDVTVVGFDDRADAALSSPPLTTIRQPLREKGAAATCLLLDCIAGKAVAGQEYLLSTELVVRASSGPPPDVARFPFAVPDPDPLKEA